MEKLEEPLVGNPPRVNDRGKLISEDLANSILEYSSITKGLQEQSKVDNLVISDFGGGYGRTAYVFLKLHSNIRYVLVDLPLSLWTAQNYLSSVFSDKKIFKFRHFETFTEIEEQFERSDIVLFTPNQLELLPNKIVDLFLNISSMHEMRKDTLKYYIGQVERVTRGYFYFKQSKISVIPYENMKIREQEYPVLQGWKRLYHRDCVFPSTFFEAMYFVGNSP